MIIKQEQSCLNLFNEIEYFEFFNENFNFRQTEFKYDNKILNIEDYDIEKKILKCTNKFDKFDLIPCNKLEYYTNDTRDKYIPFIWGKLQQLELINYDGSGHFWLISENKININNIYDSEFRKINEYRVFKQIYKNRNYYYLETKNKYDKVYIECENYENIDIIVKYLFKLLNRDSSYLHIPINLRSTKINLIVDNNETVYEVFRKISESIGCLVSNDFNIWYDISNLKYIDCTKMNQSKITKFNDRYDNLELVGYDKSRILESGQQKTKQLGYYISDFNLASKWFRFYKNHKFTFETKTLDDLKLFDYYLDGIIVKKSNRNITLLYLDNYYGNNFFIINSSKNILSNTPINVLRGDKIIKITFDNYYNQDVILTINKSTIIYKTNNFGEIYIELNENISNSKILYRSPNNKINGSILV